MRLLKLLVLFFLCSTMSASDIFLSQPILYIENNEGFAVFNVEWKNAWKNEKNSDAAWIFLKAKLPGGGYHHIKVENGGHSVIASFSDQGEVDFQVAEDQSGFFLAAVAPYRGDLSLNIKVNIDLKSLEEIKSRYYEIVAYGIEMVHIPDGAHQIGSLNRAARAYGAFYKPESGTATDGIIDITEEEQEFQVSETGDLYYASGSYLYEGDQKGPIPSTFPKGVAGFYILKYELNEGQYVAFLNTLDSSQQVARDITYEDSYSSSGGSIVKDGSTFTTDYPNKPALFTSWDDAMAFADWAALRPMTEFEYSKACRGSEAVSEEHIFPWGGSSRLGVQRLPTKDRQLVMVNGWDESLLSDSNLEQFGASYYWVMDLAGSVWERLITVGHPKGRAFTGDHGNGILDAEGFADINNWPKGSDEGGIGFRGGGFYGHDRSYHEFNPFSPIAYRRYGGWHGPMRNNAYSTRFVRTAE